MRHTTIVFIVSVSIGVGAVIFGAKALADKITTAADPKIVWIELTGADGKACHIEVAYPLGLHSIGKVQETDCPHKTFNAVMK